MTGHFTSSKTRTDHELATSSGRWLAAQAAQPHSVDMFVVTEADAAEIRTVFDQEGELSAAIELRRRFPGITDNAKARLCVRSIAGWKPPPEPVSPVTRLHPRRDGI